MGGWAHEEPSCQTILPANWDIWKKSHAAPYQWQEPSLHPCKAGYGLGWSTTGQLPCWNSALRMSSQLLPNMAWLERLGWDELGCRERTRKTFDQVENKPLRTSPSFLPVPPSFLSTSQKRTLQKVCLLLIMNKIPQFFLIKDLPMIAVPCACLFLDCCPFILLKAGRGVPSAAQLGYSKWVRFGTGPPGTAQLRRAD